MFYTVKHILENEKHVQILIACTQALRRSNETFILDVLKILLLHF